MPYSNSPVFTPAQRVQNYRYAIRNIVTHARKLEEQGRTVTYLNIGDPILYGFQPPEELIEANIQALQLGHNGYSPSSGITDAVLAIAEDARKRGIPTSAEDTIITFGASEAADLVCTSMLNPGDEVLCPAPGYPLYNAIIAKLNAREVSYTLDPRHGWLPDPDDIERKITSKTKILVVINPNNPTGEVYSKETLQQFIDIARRHRLLIITDEVYHKLVYDATHIPLASLAGDDVAVITIDSLSKNYMAPGWRTGWMMITNSRLVPDVRQAFIKLADARLCAPMTPQFSIRAAMQLDSTYHDTIVRRLRSQRDTTISMLNSIDGISCNQPEGAFYVMAQIQLADTPFTTDEEFVLKLLEEQQILFVHGSGFGTSAEDGFIRIVYLPGTDVLEDVYTRLATFVKSL
ncbi:MAG: aminotransferase class I/II-fold pyridoxal phosphate-dependent enzyme [Prosthecochloris sp.]|uniref:aminotransferase class I/II-fold pyridoxal phosphate-dependent enzyme n=1 Tax=Prosthecochloris sp. ZM_2 TaxID=2045206 RepID=UPI000DF7C192|nr:aminotransferase class I/II-fold pyridoxal phosphate-dependent enzyme [Prosthecochloris sp. ZM_2]MEC9486050.1 aminotransferase class I/II-fold pyridoxal phosphate-dependent enzyme [Prosthecochloris sp.]RNA64548.1 aminotransferase class I/II-fold pyridoxal phosphate-dependent enzyme [Prosthecochloris sp. ZM_2]